MFYLDTGTDDHRHDHQQHDQDHLWPGEDAGPDLLPPSGRSKPIGPGRQGSQEIYLKYLVTMTMSGRTALHLAAYPGNLPCLALLLSMEGVQVNNQISLQTINKIVYARPWDESTPRHVEIVKLLD